MISAEIVVLTDSSAKALACFVVLASAEQSVFFRIFVARTLKSEHTCIFADTHFDGEDFS
jgi:hypothetical protein